jgi:hypothetical protein
LAVIGENNKEKDFLLTGAVQRSYIQASHQVAVDQNWRVMHGVIGIV